MDVIAMVALGVLGYLVIGMTIGFVLGITQKELALEQCETVVALLVWLWPFALVVFAFWLPVFALQRVLGRGSVKRSAGFDALGGGRGSSPAIASRTSSTPSPGLRQGLVEGGRVDA